jgi:hypothetical protein
MTATKQLDAPARPTAANEPQGVRVRKNLCELRRMWNANTPVDPFYCAMDLDDGLTAGEFAFEHVCIHHVRRKPDVVPHEPKARRID